LRVTLSGRGWYSISGVRHKLLIKHILIAHSGEGWRAQDRRRDPSNRPGNGPSIRVRPLLTFQSGCSAISCSSLDAQAVMPISALLPNESEAHSFAAPIVAQRIENRVCRAKFTCVAKV
jgi:hypothetical protein